MGAWEKFVADSGVMTYFHGAFNRLFIEGGMRDELLKQKKIYDGYRVWVTGHSLGGSLGKFLKHFIIIF